MAAPAHALRVGPDVCRFSRQYAPTERAASSGADQATDAPVRMLQKLLYLLCDGKVANLSVLRTQLYPTVKPTTPHKVSRSLLLHQARNGRGLLLDSVPNDGSHTSPAGHMRRLLLCALNDINYLETV
jgi:hypothetical protein